MAKEISYTQEILRKLIHLSSLWMVFSLALLPKLTNVVIFSVLLIVLIFVEYGYHKQWPIFVSLYGRFFSSMLREKEKGNIHKEVKFYVKIQPCLSILYNSNICIKIRIK